MIRDLGAIDVPRIRELHGLGGWKYPLPDPMGTEIMVRRGFEIDDTLVQVILARRTVELYMLSDPQWETPKWRLEVLKKLHEDVQTRLGQIGIEDGFSWIPPRVRSFERRLTREFGWDAHPWTCMTTTVKKAG